MDSELAAAVQAVIDANALEHSLCVESERANVRAGEAFNAWDQARMSTRSAERALLALLQRAAQLAVDA